MSQKCLIFSLIPVHLFLLYSIFDIYFTSPLIQNVSPFSVTYDPFAKRLVFIVIDGMRANKLFVSNMTDTPFLRKILFSRSAWGISNTHVPTETRPGHVALIAGFYEDVSSVTKGWQENAVEFDSVFNRSTETWAWGSPDVLPMFQRGAQPHKIHAYHYAPQLEDFAGNETWKLDDWVFDKFSAFLSSARTDKQLNERINKSGIIFFLHLLGMDVSGHSQKPHSELYRKNLQKVDEGLEKTIEMIDLFYGDNKTAYLITSDHGMTNWGSHGDGTLDETVTPVIGWGAGFVKSNKNTETNRWDFIDEFIRQMNAIDQKQTVSGLQKDVWQADICPLMAAILGLQIPINSVGVVPLDYLDADLNKKAQVMRTNIYQLFVQYKAKMESKRNSRLFFFREFSQMTFKDTLDLLGKGDQMLTEKKSEKAIKLYQDLSKLILDGLEYYHKYDQMWLGFLISTTFILWIIYLSTYLVFDRTYKKTYQVSWNIVLPATIFIFLYTLYNIVVKQPISYIFYEIMPFLLFTLLVTYRKNYVYTLIQLSKDNIPFLIGGLLIIESMVWSFFYRQILMIGVLMTYLFILYGAYRHKSWTDISLWTVSCGLLMIFPNLPVIGGYSNSWIVLTGALLVSLFSIIIELNRDKDICMMSVRRYKYYKYCMIFLHMYTAFHVMYCHLRVEMGFSTGWGLQIISWTIFVSVIPLAIYSSNESETRVDMILNAFAIIYNLLGIHYEMLFFLCLLILGKMWQRIERKHNDKSNDIKDITGIDQRRIIHTILYVYLLMYSFFATGNIASINSFDVKSTYCFVTVFRPFIMMTLMLVKISVPMLAVSVIRTNIEYSRYRYNSLSKYQDCLLAIIPADLAALHCLFLVRDTGTWLEIGTSISRYLIMMGVSLLCNLFTPLSHWLIHVNTVDQSKYRYQNCFVKSE